MAGHNLGCSLKYDIKSGNVDHHLKFKVNHGQGFAVVGMKNANDTELLLQQNVGKNLCLGPFGQVHLKNVYAKVNYGVGNGEYGAHLATEGDYNYNDQFKASFKQVYNPISGGYMESMKFNVSESLAATISHKTNAHDGMLKNIQFGAALNFSL